MEGFHGSNVNTMGIGIDSSGYNEEGKRSSVGPLAPLTSCLSVCESDDFMQTGCPTAGPRCQSPMSAYFNPSESSLVGWQRLSAIGGVCHQGNSIFSSSVPPDVDAQVYLDRSWFQDALSLGEEELVEPLLGEQTEAISELPPQLPMSNEWQLPERYRLGKLLGTGAYGSVCEAWDCEEQRRVAVKRIDGIFRDDVHCKRIIREVTILSHLRHSHVVQIYDLPKPPNLDWFEDLYIVMERCDTDLRKVCNDLRGVSLPQARRLAYGLLLGLRYLHLAGVYHRDLKPANCLVNHDCSVKICDFNLARAVDHGELCVSRAMAAERALPSCSASPKQLRRALTVHVASRWYRPPEVILALGYSEAMDVWSAGCIIAEIFISLNTGGRRPRRGVLFPGGECFPLSQGSSVADTGPDIFGDQLDLIFNALGTPSEAELEAIACEDVSAHLRYYYPARQGVGLSACLPPEAGAAGLDLLTRMLRFLADHRATTAEALQHPFFAKVRKLPEEVQEEGASPGRLQLCRLSDGGDEPELERRVSVGRRKLRQEICRFHRRRRRCGRSTST